MYQLVVALGNPGKEYETTRHNIAWILIDQHPDLKNLNWKSKFKALYAETSISGEKIFFLKPQTYMNLSGESVQPFSQFYEKIKNGKVIHHNLFYGLPFHTNTVPYIFSSHFMEHLTYDSAKFVLMESHRVLKPGGMIRILVPSLDTEVERMKDAISVYAQGDISSMQKFMSEPYEELHDPFSHHRYMYNVPAMIQLFNEAGFSTAIERQPGEGNFPDLHLLEKRKSIIVEAVK